MRRNTVSTKELQIKTLSSLAKVFPQRIVGSVKRGAVGFRGTEISFQVALRITPRRYTQEDYTVEVTSALAEHITLSRVGLVPSALPAYGHGVDKGYITTTSQMFPDPLLPLEDGKFCAATYNWRALWVSVQLPADLVVGEYPVTLRFWRKGKCRGTASFLVTVRPEQLPESDFLYTNWFHCDCIADVHGVPVLSEAHWALMEKYMQLAAAHGMNMILTPVVTPPLDTAVGTERPTVQLVGVEKMGESYTFDFTLLRRFVQVAKRCGIAHFEISHLFTQWGAAFTPKVVARVGGRRKKIFGWHVPSDDPAYAAFLQALVPELIAFFEGEDIPRKNLYFHVSDEPGAAHLTRYRAVSAVLRPLIEGCHHIDALSELDFYREGLVSTPVVATNRIAPYLDERVEELWCYHCCSQCHKVSNRFFAMPSPRTRAIGVQMYKYGIKGFLHWGYNFYYSQYSKRLVDPFRETDAGEAFPSGDAFIVYPHGEGVIPSLRLKVFAEALEDMRLLTLWEQRAGRERVIAALDELMGEPITFDTCPTTEKFYDALYERIFAELN